jgi:multimeric flavodoxin WrbA
MKVIAFNGSPRRSGNTAVLINIVLCELEEEGIDTEVYELAGKKIRGCLACFRCFQNRDRRCSVSDDVLNECIEKMIEADGIILGSPTYFTSVTAEMKALIDRAGLVAMANGNMFRRKVGAAVVAVRRAGSIPVFDSINHFFLIGEMIVPGSNYWNMGFGHGGLRRDGASVEQDQEGIRTMKVLGENMAWLLKKMQG